jgi:ribose/xylose/arabinose/galactoside ABC-type transport system permease subunit
LSDFATGVRAGYIGSTFERTAGLRIDAYYQEIVKGMIIVAAVIIDQYRQRKRRKV